MADDDQLSGLSFFEKFQTRGRRQSPRKYQPSFMTPNAKNTTSQLQNLAPLPDDMQSPSRVDKRGIHPLIPNSASQTALSSSPSRNDKRGIHPSTLNSASQTAILSLQKLEHSHNRLHTLVSSLYSAEFGFRRGDIESQKIIFCALEEAAAAADEAFQHFALSRHLHSLVLVDFSAHERDETTGGKSMELLSPLPGGLRSTIGALKSEDLRRTHSPVFEQKQAPGSQMREKNTRSSSPEHAFDSRAASPQRFYSPNRSQFQRR
jgi:hypothetical protein